MAPEAWSKKYLALALAALLCFNAFQLCQYLVSRRGSASTVRLLLRSATSESPHAPFDEEGLAEALPKLQRSHSEVDLQPEMSQPAVRQSNKQPRSTPVFILYSWNFDLFWTSLQTYVAAGWGPYLVIVDNSQDRRVLHDAKVQGLVAEVIPTRVQLTFSQLQNFIADVAIERNYEYYFWGHADVALLASSASSSFSEEIFGCIERASVSHPSWGILLFAHDWFSAIRTPLVRKVKYDTFITVYMSDCDYYPRVRAAGWLTLDFTEACPNVPLKVYDMKRPLDLPLEDYERSREMLDAEEEVDVDRNAWKRDAWQAGEEFGWDNWGAASQTYFREKWNTTGETGNECRENEVPAEGSGDGMRLSQKPFQAYAASRDHDDRRRSRSLRELA